MTALRRLPAFVTLAFVLGALEACSSASPGAPAAADAGATVEAGATLVPTDAGPDAPAGEQDSGDGCLPRDLILVEAGTEAGPPAPIDVPQCNTKVGVGCNALVNDAVSVHVTNSNDTPPAPAGGALTSGTYHLTSFTSYGPSPQCQPKVLIEQYQITAVVDAAAGTLNTASLERDELGSRETYTAGTISTSGTTLSTTDTCPSVASDAEPYTATPTTLTLFSTDTEACGTTVIVFTKG